MLPFTRNVQTVLYLQVACIFSVIFYKFYAGLNIGGGLLTFFILSALILVVFDEYFCRKLKEL